MTEKERKRIHAYCVRVLRECLDDGVIPDDIQIMRDDDDGHLWYETSVDNPGLTTRPPEGTSVLMSVEQDRVDQNGGYGRWTVKQLRELVAEELRHRFPV